MDDLSIQVSIINEKNIVLEYRKWMLVRSSSRDRRKIVYGHTVTPEEFAEKSTIVMSWALSLLKPPKESHTFLMFHGTTPTGRYVALKCNKLDTTIKCLWLQPHRICNCPPMAYSTNKGRNDDGTVSQRDESASSNNLVPEQEPLLWKMFFSRLLKCWCSHMITKMHLSLFTYHL